MSCRQALLQCRISATSTAISIFNWLWNLQGVALFHTFPLGRRPFPRGPRRLVSREPGAGDDEAAKFMKGERHGCLMT